MRHTAQRMWLLNEYFMLKALNMSPTQKSFKFNLLCKTIVAKMIHFYNLI